MPKTFASLLAVPLFVLPLMGCGSDDSTPSVTNDAATGGDTNAATDSAPGADSASTDDTATATDSGSPADADPADASFNPCAPVPNVGATISKVTHAGAAPTMTGGTIADGTYVLTAFDLYGGATGTSTHKMTLVLKGGDAVHVDSKDGAADKITYVKYTTSGSSFTMSTSCGGSGSVTVGYTATATTFMMNSPGMTNEVLTYTKK